MPIMEINIIPLGTKTPSVSKYIADALRVLGKEKNIIYELTAMGTIVETDSLDLLLTLAKKMHRAVSRGERRAVPGVCKRNFPKK